MPCLHIRAHCLFPSQKTQQALDPILVLRAPPATPRSNGVAPAVASSNPSPTTCPDTKVTFEVKDFQTAVRDGDMLGNEVEREIQGVLGLIYLLGGAYLVTIEASEIVGSAPHGNGGSSRTNSRTSPSTASTSTSTSTNSTTSSGGSGSSNGSNGSSSSNNNNGSSSCSIHRVRKMGLVPISRRQQAHSSSSYFQQQQHPSSLDTPDRVCDEERYLGMLQAPVVAGSLYFSPQYPLHRRLQENAKLCPDLDFDSTAPLFWGKEESEEESEGPRGPTDDNKNYIAGNPFPPSPSHLSSQFLWNNFLLSGLESARHFWGTACISGFASSRSIPLQRGRAGSVATLTLISRRSTRMQGTRFWQRGGNERGEVANFVETEVVICLPLPQTDEEGRGEEDEDEEKREVLLLSYVQVRGSIPLPWSQEPELKWQPRVRLPSILPPFSISSMPPAGGAGTSAVTGVAAAHFQQQLLPVYGEVLAINLVDSCGENSHSQAQKTLGRLFQEEVERLPGYTPSLIGEGWRKGEREGGEKTAATKMRSSPFVGGKERQGGGEERPRLSLTWFDFHKECGSYKKWGRLHTHLLAHLDPLIFGQGWTVVRLGRGGMINSRQQQKKKQQQQQLQQEAALMMGEGERANEWGSLLVREQRGVVRTNCMDNLDRTNVVQSMIASRVLGKALSSLPSSSPSSPDLPSLEQALMTLWAANADALSTLYAGTPALKTDFVLTGHRTVKGILLDGFYALTRLYINNFWDGYRQDCVSLWLGNYQPSRSSSSSPFPPYRLPFTPGGFCFTLSVALQELAPYQLTLQVGPLFTEAVVSLAQALAGSAAAVSSGREARGQDGESPSWLVQVVFGYVMFALFWLALGECILCLGPFATLRLLRRERHLLVDRPRLVRRGWGRQEGRVNIRK